jgi:hypothetical protein
VTIKAVKLQKLRYMSANLPFHKKLYQAGIPILYHCFPCISMSYKGYEECVTHTVVDRLGTWFPGSVHTKITLNISTVQKLIHLH